MDRYSVVKSIALRVVREPSATRGANAGSPGEAAAIFRSLIPDDAREHFGILLLNTQNKVIGYHEVSVGTLNASLVSPREVFRAALAVPGVNSIILGHNHPSGDPTPSPEDEKLTRQLVDAGKLMDIRIHDHVILGNGGDAFTSFARTGRL